jgi:hypothetical protein
MHDQPKPTEEEHELASDPDRQRDEDAMRGPEHDDPDEQRKRSGAGTDDE